MDTETRRAIDRIEEDIRTLRCPQSGCRYMESKGARATQLANWISTVALAAFIIFEIVRSS
jgi:hypothetical protein